MQCLPRRIAPPMLGLRPRRVTEGPIVARGLPGVTRVAEGLPVRRIEERALVAAVRSDVVDMLGSLAALDADPVLPQVLGSDLLPSACAVQIPARGGPLAHGVLLVVSSGAGVIDGALVLAHASKFTKPAERSPKTARRAFLPTRQLRDT